jgi:pre-mRNA-processing factor 17
MHAIPAAAAHPNLKYMVGQSMDNKIVVYESKSTFRLSRKKKFTGHQNAGYAIGLSFSPDGKFLASGDSEGKLWFWDWKTAKVYRTMKVHDSVCIDVQWHPIDPSRMFTCSWDGTIKMWD